MGDWGLAESAWRAAWLEQDFSWNGLARKTDELEGTSWNSLQDYWLTDAKTGVRRTTVDLIESRELIEFENTLWHMAHLPILGRSQFSPKIQWREQDWETLSRLLQSRATALSAGDEGERSIVLFQGIVARTPPAFSSDLDSDVYLDWASFLADVTLDETRFGSLTMNNAAFQSRFSMRSAIVVGQLQSSDARFRNQAVFSASDLREGAFFEDAVFDEGGWFHQTVFGDATSFSRSIFHHYAGFYEARFLGNCHFGGVVVKRRTNLSNAEFAGAPRFQAAQLTEDVLFEGVRFPQYVAAQWAGCAAATIVLIILLACSIASAVLSGFASLACFALAVCLAILYGGCLKVGGGSIARGLGIRDLEADVRAFRKLVLIAEGQRNRRHAAEFHRMELKAQRLHWRTDPFERAFSWLYDVLGGYGESIWRPLASAATSGLVLAAAYYIWAYSDFDWRFIASHMPAPGRSVDPNFISAIGFSVENMVRPFSIWTTSPASDECKFVDALVADSVRCQPLWISTRPLTDIRSHELAVRMVASGQTILSLTLLFLFGLSIRRKFQVAG